MPLMQLERNGQYAALYQQSLQTRQIFLLIKSTNKQKKKNYFPYPTPSSVHETQDQTNPQLITAHRTTSHMSIKVM